MNDKEMLNLAEEIINGKVFGDWMLPKKDITIVHSVFMPLTLMSSKMRQKLKDDKIVSVYEHLSEAGSRLINGYPMFMSCHYITEADLPRLKSIVDKLSSAMTKAKNDILMEKKQD